METENIKIKTLLIIIAAIALIEGAAIFLSSGRHLSPMLVIGIVRIIEIIAIIIAVMTCGNGMPSIGLKISTIATGIKKGLIWSAVFGLITSFVFLVLYLSGINPLTLLNARRPESNIGISQYIIVGCIIGPVAEEFFFRGVLYGFFRRWGIITAMIFTTIIFILPHFNASSIPVTQAVGGIIFAAAYEKEKSLIVPIIIHILGNAAIFILPFIF